MQLPAKHDFSENFERDKFDGKTVDKGEYNDFVTRLFKIQSHNLFEFCLHFHLIYTYGKTMSQP